MREIGSRRRNQPAPPQAVFEALTAPYRKGGRPWLHLLGDEKPPANTYTECPDVVVWSSIWVKRPDAVIRFELPSDGAGGTDLRWILTVEDPIPDESSIGHFRKRMNELINAKLRFSFGQ